MMDLSEVIDALYRRLRTSAIPRTAGCLVLIGVLIGFPLTGPARAAETPTPAAVFDIELIDTSGEQGTGDHADRIAKASAVLRDRLAEAGYRPVDLAPFAGRIEAIGHRYSCDGCLRDIAADAGAAVVVTAAVHKVSSLILTIDIAIETVPDGRRIAAGTADIRGDNDRSWIRGVEWLVRNRLAQAAH
jgi:hypothetical protein